MEHEKTILINALREDAMRTAIVSGKKLLDCEYDHTTGKQRKGDIILGIVRHIESSLDAAFIDTGSPSGRHAFLPFKEISPEYFHGDEKNPNKVNIKDVIREGQHILVQIDKEERGKKGAALTTYISLAGCYLVLMPNNPRAGGISRRIEGEDREEIKSILNQLDIEPEMGVIVRTAGVGREMEELQWDLDVLKKQWQAIRDVATSDREPPYLIHQENDIVVRTIRDYLRPGVSKILVDNPAIHARFLEHLAILKPEFVSVELYEESTPLFTKYNIESQMEAAFTREVRLPSGGSIVIDHTEALTAFDVNSGRSTSGDDIEKTALHTNLEAADAIATQLRLRDIGGLIVIDFIDMGPSRNQREVENLLRKAVKLDRARIQIGRISRFGLLEMSRQRLRPSLEESHQVVCDRCQGQGSIRSVESLSLSIMRLIEEQAISTAASEIGLKFYVQVPVDVATYLINEKRQDLISLDTTYNVNIIIVPNPDLLAPQYKIDTLETDIKFQKAAFKTMDEMDKSLEAAQIRTEAHHGRSEEPAIKKFDLPTARKRKSFIKRMLDKLMGEELPASSGSRKKPSEGEYTGRRKGPAHKRKQGQRSQHPKSKTPGQAAKSQHGSKPHHASKAPHKDKHPRTDKRRHNKPVQDETPVSESAMHQAKYAAQQEKEQQGQQRGGARGRGRGRHRGNPQRRDQETQHTAYEAHQTPSFNAHESNPLPPKPVVTEKPAAPVQAPVVQAPATPAAPTPIKRDAPMVSAAPAPKAVVDAPKPTPAPAPVATPAPTAAPKPAPTLGSFERKIPMKEKVEVDTQDKK